MTTRRSDRQPFDAIEVGIRRLRLLAVALLGLVLLLPGGHRPDPVGAAILAVLAGLVLIANHTSGRLDAGLGAPESTVALQIGIDVTATVGTLLVLDLDPGAAAWLIVALPVVEGALRYGLLGGVSVWLTTVVPLLGWAILGWSPGDGLTTVTQSGGVLAVALALGLPAGLAADRLAAEWRSRTRYHQHLEDQATHLAVLAVAAEELAGADDHTACRTLVEATVELGFPGAELVMVDTASGHHHPLASQPDGYATASMAGPELTALLSAAPGTTRIGAEAEPMALLARADTSITVLAAGPEDGDRRQDRHDAFAALSRYGAASLTAVAHRQSIVEAAEQQERRRLRDPRTGLLNRAGFEPAVSSILEHLAPGAELWLFAIDVIEFDQVVVTAGRVAAEQVINEIGARIARTSPAEAAVAQLDLDRFAVATSDPAARYLAEHLPDILARPIATEHGPVTVRVSVGQVITPDPSTHPMAVIEEAQRRAGGSPSRR